MAFRSRSRSARTRDTIEICRKVWSGDRVTHEGHHLRPAPRRGRNGARQATQVHEPTTGERHPDRAGGSIGPKNVELTAEVADIWQTIHFVPDRFHQVWGDSLAAGTAKRPADKAPLEILAGGTVALGSGPHVDEAREAARGSDRLLRRWHGRQEQELLQRPLQALRLGAGGRGDPGSLPVRQARRGDRRGPRRVHRPVVTDAATRATSASGSRSSRTLASPTSTSQPHGPDPAADDREDQGLERVAADAALSCERGVRGGLPYRCRRGG